MNVALKQYCRNLNWSILVSVDNQCTERFAKSSWKREERLHHDSNRSRGIDAPCQRVTIVICVFIQSS